MSLHYDSVVTLSLLDGVLLTVIYTCCVTEERVYACYSAAARSGCLSVHSELRFVNLFYQFHFIRTVPFN